ncbi:hypothetical protein CJ030_MR6G020538 [Morella rubra]|uniref:RNase H type-1 domain-containing protein n=1 Tax=Morella rubra TaxID=262757 RepID=A0A6A1VCJ6_9ROSI|nr:hypothetical protein CJ030_MR0G006554 [Morella rubra]KAB1209588.1 hypothetical protein CJ030_MR6G020538 [Morella rubra]
MYEEKKVEVEELQRQDAHLTKLIFAEKKITASKAVHEVWRQPPPNYIKINVDAASSRLLVVAAAVFRDCNGEFKGVAAVKLNQMSPVEVEVQAAKL